MMKRETLSNFAKLATLDRIFDSIRAVCEKKTNRSKNWEDWVNNPELKSVLEGIDLDLFTDEAERISKSKREATAMIASVISNGRNSALHLALARSTPANFLRNFTKLLEYALKVQELYPECFINDYRAMDMVLLEKARSSVRKGRNKLIGTHIRFDDESNVVRSSMRLSTVLSNPATIQVPSGGKIKVKSGPCQN